jgi:hypothetical protein
MKLFYCSTCSECYYIHPQELTTVCRCIVLFRCVLVYWLRFGWSRVVCECRLDHYYCSAPIHTETEQYTHIQSPAPEDECNNIRNILSNKKTFIKWHQVVSIYSNSKMMHGPITIRSPNTFKYICSDISEITVNNAKGVSDDI